MTNQWIHLDFKGMIPDEPRLLQWLTWMRQCGFSGVVFEYEDRIPWESWPGTFRPGYDVDAWQRIWRHAAQLGFEIVPLIQTFGHLEWLLKHDRYASLREAGFWNLLCPQHDQVLPQLKNWIDEVIRLHPDSQYIHVGLDEVHHLASCPKCESIAKQSKEGKLRVYLEHAGRVVEHVRSRGRTPILWADMFFHPEQRLDLIEQLPDAAVLCDWRYSGATDFDSPVARNAVGRTVMAASAIRCGFDPPYELVADLNSRLDNVRGWHRAAEQPGVKLSSVIHTTWGRSRSLMPLYGPWEGWLPAFIAAGRPGAEVSRPLTEGMALLHRGLSAVSHLPLLEAAKALREVRSDDPLEQQALRWWDIALRHRHELWWAEKPLTVGYESLLAVQQHVGMDPDILALKRRERESVVAHLGALAVEIRSFCQDNRWSDVPELIDSRINNVLRHLQRIPM